MLPYLCPGFFVGIFRASKWNRLQFPQIWVTAMARKSFNKKYSHQIGEISGWFMYILSYYILHDYMLYVYIKRKMCPSNTIGKIHQQKFYNQKISKWKLEFQRVMGNALLKSWCRIDQAFSIQHVSFICYLRKYEITNTTLRFLWKWWLEKMTKKYSPNGCLMVESKKSH